MPQKARVNRSGIDGVNSRHQKNIVSRVASPWVAVKTLRGGKGLIGGRGIKSNQRLGPEQLRSDVALENGCINVRRGKYQLPKLFPCLRLLRNQGGERPGKSTVAHAVRNQINTLRVRFVQEILQEQLQIRLRPLSIGFVNRVSLEGALGRPAVKHRRSLESEIIRNLGCPPRRVLESDIVAVNEYERLLITRSFDVSAKIGEEPHFFLRRDS